MNYTFQYLWRCALLVTLMGVSTPGSGKDKDRLKGIMPVDLELLFSALPEKVEGWELTKSKGWRGHYRWVESIVMRDFEMVVKGEKGAPVSRKVKIVLKDTGKFPESDIQFFSNFTPGKGPSVERLYINSIPAIISERDTKLVAHFLLEERFSLNITFYGVPKTRLADWFRRIDVASLSSIQDGPIVTLPDHIVDQSINQITDTKSSFLLGVGEVDQGEEEEEGDEQ